MTTPSHILVATDFSEASSAALDRARELAKTFGAKLTLLHVYSPSVDALGTQQSTAERMRIGTEVHEALATLKNRATGLAEVHAEVVAADDVVGHLVDYAASHGVDLIVIGSHGRTGMKKLMLGSVASGIVGRAGCSVLVARG